MRFVLAVEALYLHAELVGKDGVEEYAHESGEGKTGKGDGANLQKAFTEADAIRLPLLFTG